MTTKTKSVKKVQKHETIINDSPRTFDDFPTGCAAHQGDVIFVSIAAVPKGAKPRKNRQLADGNTQGSRHVLIGGELWNCDLKDVAKAISVACPKARVDEKYIGPVFRGPCEIDHPEHGNHIHTTDAVIAVVYQRNLDADEREQRTID